MSALTSTAAPTESPAAVASSALASQPRHSASSSIQSGAASPTGGPSSSHPSRTRFDSAQLQPHLTSTLTKRLRNAAWDKSDKDKNRALSRSIAEVIKGKMLEIEPKGFKYIVQVQLVENLGQGGSRPRMSLGRHGLRGTGHVFQRHAHLYSFVLCNSNVSVRMCGRNVTFAVDLSFARVRYSVFGESFRLFVELRVLYIWRVAAGI